MNKGWIGLILIAVLLITGCDQKVPLDLSQTCNISGVVYEYNYSGNVTDRTKKLDLVTVFLSGPLNVSTVTATDGAFAFTAVPLGKYVITASREGYQRNAKVAYSMVYDLSSVTPGSQQSLEFDLDPRPVFLGASCQDNEEIPTGTSTFKLYFSEPISRETVVGFVKEVGVRAAAISLNRIFPLSLSWEADAKTMILTLKHSLESDAIYQLGIGCSNPVLGIRGIIDQQNNQIYGTQLADYSANNYSSDTNFGTYYYVPFKTAADKSSQPEIPNGLAVISSVTGSAEIDYNSVYSANSGFTLTFNGSAGANGYRLYASNDGGLAYLFVKEFNTSSTFIAISDLVTAFGSSLAVGYDSYGYPVEPGLPWPLLGTGLYLKVSAYNSLGESDSSLPLLVVDTVKPSATTTVVAESDVIKVIKYSEPLNRTSAENPANYMLQGGGAPTILCATLVNDYTYGYQTYKNTYVRLVLSAADAGPRHVLISGVKDLSGNQIIDNTDVAY